VVDDVKPVEFPGIVAATYDGDSTTEERAWVRSRANVVFTNPEMLHSGLLPNHQRWATFFGRLRYVVCLRFSAHDSDGGYEPPRERAALFVDGRFDRIIENAVEPCAGAAYAAFPDLEKMTR
jgi:hypothetical protein